MDDSVTMYVDGIFVILPKSIAMCLICRQKPSSKVVNFYPIFKKFFNGTRLDQMIENVFGIDLDENNEWPPYMCDDCLPIVQKAFELKNTFSQNVLKFYNSAKRRKTCEVMNYLNTARLLESSNTENGSHFSGSASTSRFHDVQPVTERNDSENNDNVVMVPDFENNDNVVMVPDFENNDDDDDDDDDDEDCQIVEPPSPTIIFISDSENNDNDSGDDLPRVESNEVEITQHQDVDELFYCSICMSMKPTHNCSEVNKELSTCLIPLCDMVFRSKKEFDVHYSKHVGISPGAKMCKLCFRENSSSYSKRPHIHANTETLYKCHTCKVILNNMVDLAKHKLQKHDAILFNSENKYLCSFCEFDSMNKMEVIAHRRICLENQKKKCIFNQVVPTDNNSKKLLTSHQKLFTCFFCDLIYVNFQGFKNHYLSHSNIPANLMCWQCFKPLESIKALRCHQKNKCYSLDLIKCNTCSEICPNMLSLSIHTYIKHNATLIHDCRMITCMICGMDVPTKIFRGHLISHL